MNSLVVVDVDGFFIYTAAGFPGSFHDLTVLKHCDLHQNAVRYFTRDPHDRWRVGNIPVSYIERMLGDLGYIDREVQHYVLTGRRDDGGGHAIPRVVREFNLHLNRKRISVEWGIGGLKKRFAILTGMFPLERREFGDVFNACCRLQNFFLQTNENWKLGLSERYDPVPYERDQSVDGDVRFWAMDWMDDRAGERGNHRGDD
jgi:hypothetical protein